MKKIMFSERFGLEQAVLAGTKTMTRRIIPLCENDLNFLKITERGEWLFSSRTCLDGAYPAYNVGEEVAVAQSYKHIYDAMDERDGNSKANEWWCELYDNIGDVMAAPGYRNKMFVKADLMPHRIRITGIKAERLQDIGDEDAMREGIFKYDKPPLHHEYDMFAPWPPYVRPYKWDSNNLIYRCTARYAFAYLIDKISGEGTWQSNPWVYAYTFELIK